MRKPHRILLVFCLCLSVLTGARAQNLRRITNKDGLSSNYVLSLCQRNDGLMMFGAVNGLNYYDGNNIWSPALYQQSLLGELIEDIVAVREDEVWVLTNQGLNIIVDNGEQLLNYPQFKGLRCIQTNGQGEAFMLNDGLLSYRDANGEFRSASIPGIFVDEVMDYTIIDKYLYIFHKDGIFRYALTRTDGIISISNEELLDDMPLQSANKVAGAAYLTNTEGELYRYDLKTGSKRYLVSLRDEISVRGSITDIIEFKGNLLLAFSNKGVLSLDLQKSDYLLSDLGIVSGVFCMVKDNLDEIVWIATDGQGVYMYNDDAYTILTFTAENMNMGFSSPVRAIYKDISGTLWVGTKGEGLIMFPDSKPSTRTPSIKLTQASSCLTSNIIYSLEHSDYGGFWIGTATGLFYGDGHSSNIIPAVADIPIKEISAIKQSDGQIWMTTMGYGVFRADIFFDNGQPILSNIKQFIVDEGRLSSNMFFCLARDKQGTWWFGNRDEGLFTIINNRLASIPFDPELFRNHTISNLTALHPVEDDIWIGTGDGIVIQGREGIKNIIDIQNGLPNNTIAGIVYGEDGVWVTTNRGIALLSPDGDVIRSFGEKDLDIIEYGSAAVKFNDAYYFGGPNGATIFQRNEYKRPQKLQMNLVFTTLSINGKPQNIAGFLSDSSEGQTLRLGPDQRSFMVGASTMEYLHAPTIRYYYRLSNTDSWIDNGQNNVFTFTQLSYGHHSLYIKYKDNIDGTESPVFTLPIIVSPPWYLSSLACLCYFLLALTIVWLLMRNWVKKQEEKQALRAERQSQIDRDRQYEEKMTFLTNVVHELNTPLTLIYGPCERLMSHEADNQFVKKYVGQIERNLKRLNSLVQEIIDFRRITSGYHVIKVMRVDFSSLMNSYYDSFSEMADRNHIDYRRQIADGIIWNSDAAALSRIVINLISNAFKYTKPDGRIEVSFSVEDGNAIISVYNTGAGISEADQKRVFDYYRVFNNAEESSSGEQTSRNGIGMAICHKMVEQLGGSITIDSKVGEYTRFIVTLPQCDLPEGSPTDQAPLTSEDFYRRPISNDQISDLQTSTKSTGAPRPKRLTGETAPTILAIDDNQEILNLLSDALEGYHILLAHNGDEGLKRLKEEQPDLIITDLMMPGSDGFDFIQQLKQNRHTVHIPLVILSAKSSEEERIEGMESGADVYISKPFSTNYLLSVVDRLLESRKELKDYYSSGASAHSYVSGKLVSNYDRKFIDSLVDEMEAHLKDEDLTPEILASLLGCSLRNLYRKFELAQLPTPKEYIKAYKTNAAARLLTTTSMTVQEVIYSTGFKSRSQFYTEFKKHFGISPIEYRKQRQGGE